MNSGKPSKLMPALIGGVTLGTLSALPVINFLNCFCCLLVIGGGVLASHLYLKDTPAGVHIDYGDGAVLGLLTGVFGALAELVVSIPLKMVAASFGGDFIQAALDQIRQQPDVPPEMIQALEGLSQGEAGMIGLVIGLLFNLIILPIFAAIGACIGVAMFQKNTPPPPSAPGSYQPPPTSPPVSTTPPGGSGPGTPPPSV